MAASKSSLLGLTDLFGHLEPLPLVHRVMLTSGYLAANPYFCGLTLNRPFQSVFVFDQKEPLFVDAKKKVADVVKQMAKRNESYALVRVANTITGICTSSHLASAMANKQDDKPVLDVMEKNEEIVSCRVNDTLADICTTMAQSGAENLAIKDVKGNIVYVVSCTEIIKKLFGQN